MADDEKSTGQVLSDSASTVAKQVNHARKSAVKLAKIAKDSKGNWVAAAASAAKEAIKDPEWASKAILHIAIFSVIPDVHNPYAIFSALFVQMLFTDITGYADSLPDQVCPVPVNMILDEFANLGKLIDFEQKPAVVRSRGIAIAMIVQSLRQLQRNYKDFSWEAIIGTCAIWLILGSQDDFTMKYISAMAGTATINTESQQQPTRLSIFNFGMPRSVGEGKRNVINPDEIRRMPWMEELILLEHKNPLRAYKFIHTGHPFSKECIKTQIYYMPKITDSEGREYWEAMEQERIMQYYAWQNSGMTQPKPRVLTMEEIAAGTVSLTEYKKQWEPETIVVSNLVWTAAKQEENHFKGKLSQEEAKNLKQSHPATPQEKKPKKDVKMEEKQQEPAKSDSPKPTQTQPPASPRPAQPNEKSNNVFDDLFGSTQGEDNEMLQKAFGLTQTGRGMPKRNQQSQNNNSNGLL